jgi:inner membrane protein
VVTRVVILQPTLPRSEPPGRSRSRWNAPSGPVAILRISSEVSEQPHGNLRVLNHSLRVASLGHVAVGMLVGRTLPPGSDRRTAGTMAVCAGLALLPDLDYLGVMMGLVDSGPCGHRGATHSLIVPLLVASLAAAISPRFNLPRWRTAVLCGLAVASHALLDAMTVGSRGVPLLWPFTFARFEMPWRPIPNAPCGLHYLSAQGLRVATIELFQFFPVLLLALWPRSRRTSTASPSPPEARIRMVGSGRMTHPAA